MISYCKINREEFAAYLSKQKAFGQNHLTQVDTFNNIKLQGKDMVLCWNTSKSAAFELPRVIILPDDAISDFFAWVTTYFRHMRPFSAHCRIISSSFIDNFYQKSSHPYLDKSLRFADVGLIIAEGIIYSHDKIAIDKLPISAFLRTLSFIFAKCFNMYDKSFYQNIGQLKDLSHNWTLSRTLTNQALLDLSPNCVEEVWSIIFKSAISTNLDMNDSEKFIVDGINEIISLGRISLDTLSRYTIPGDDYKDMLAAMEGPREKRVKILEKLVYRLVDNNTIESKMTQSFIVGYFTSLIQPGSLDHFQILIPLVRNIPESLLWYGACAGLLPECTIDKYRDGLSLLIKREIERSSSLLDRPLCDVSLQELKVILGAQENFKIRFNTYINGILSVEISPLINAHFRWHDYPSEKFHAQVSNKNNKQRSLFDNEENTRELICELLEKIDESSKALNYVRNKVKKTFNVRSNTKAKSDK